MMMWNELSRVGIGVIVVRTVYKTFASYFILSLLEREIGSIVSSLGDGGGGGNGMEWMSGHVSASTYQHPLRHQRHPSKRMAMKMMLVTISFPCLVLSSLSVSSSV
mmetsp:Transcript_14527/g.16837  ORF Transcript_14527/g.16837 Transcript_14527/m.16837 type:complete len:106 (-) Transcript_14527:6-323(-)